MDYLLAGHVPGLTKFNGNFNLRDVSRYRKLLTLELPGGGAPPPPSAITIILYSIFPFVFDVRFQ